MFLKATLSTQGPLKKIQHFEIYWQYIGVGCTRSALARQQSFEKVPSSSGQHQPLNTHEKTFQIQSIGCVNFSSTSTKSITWLEE